MKCYWVDTSLNQITKQKHFIETPIFGHQWLDGAWDKNKRKATAKRRQFSLHHREHSVYFESRSSLICDVEMGDDVWNVGFVTKRCSLWWFVVSDTWCDKNERLWRSLSSVKCGRRWWWPSKRKVKQFMTSWSTGISSRNGLISWERCLVVSRARRISRRFAILLSRDCHAMISNEDWE